MQNVIRQHWGTMVGITAVAIVPLVFLDRIDRYVLLPQLTIAMAGIAFGFVALGLFGREGKGAKALSLAFAFLGVQVLSVAGAHTPTLAIVPLINEFAFASLLLIVVVGFTQRDVDRTVCAVAYASVIVSTIGLLQYFDIGRAWIPSSGLPSATLGHRNIAAVYALASLPFIALQFHSTRVRGLSLWWALGLSMNLSFIISTRSRAAWVSLAMAGAFGLAVWLRTRRGANDPVDRHKLGALFGALLLVVLLAASPASIGKSQGEAMWHRKASVGETVRSIADADGDKGRLILWDATLEMIQNQPIIGVGPGNWRIAYPAYAEGRMIDARVVPYRVHNDLLTIGSESGLVALGFYICLIILALRESFRPGDNSGLSLAAAIAVVGTILSGLFGFTREFYGASAPLWLSLGILIRAGSYERPQRPLRGIICIAGAAVSVVVLAIVIQLIRYDGRMVDARIASAGQDWSSVIDATEVATDWPVDDTAFLLRGRAFNEVGRIQEAVEAYRTGLRLHPHSTSLWMGLGVTQRKLGSPGAEESFQWALHYDPQDGRVLTNLGTLTASQGRMDEAISYLERALKAQSTPPSVYGSLSAAYRRKGMLDQAVDAARQGYELAPGADMANALGLALMATGSVEEAIEIYRSGLSSIPDHAQILYNLARALDRKGASGDAIRTYQEVLKRLDGRFPDRRKSIEQRITLIEQGRGSR